MRRRTPPSGRVLARLTAAVITSLAAASACTDSVSRVTTPSPLSINTARDRADSVDYYASHAARVALASAASSKNVNANGTSSVVSVTPGWFQGAKQKLPITAVVSGPVNAVTVIGDGAILCSGSYGSLIAYDANGAVLGTAPLTLIAPSDCGVDNVTFGAQATVTVTQGIIASFKILPMSPFDFSVLGTAGGRASATYTAILGETIPPVDAPPRASFSAGCDYVTLTCTLDGTSSTDDVGIVSYVWDLNKSPGGVASGPTVTVTYPVAGPRTVSLTVTDTKGQTNTLSMTIQVGVVAGTPPFVNFSTSCAVLACTFDSSPSVGSSAIVRAWTFGDGGNAGDVVVPSHTYAAPGIYAVTLTARDALGLSSTSAIALKIGLPIGGPSGMGMSSDCSSPGTCTFVSNVSGGSPPFVLS